MDEADVKSETLVYMPDWMFKKIRKLRIEDEVLEAAFTGGTGGVVRYLTLRGFDYRALEPPEFGAAFDATFRRRAARARIRKLQNSKGKVSA
jgi:hypothetical protein